MEGRRYKDLVPLPLRQWIEREGLEKPDWYIRPAANHGIYIDELEEALPSSLLDGEFAERVLRGET